LDAHHGAIWAEAAKLHADLDTARIWDSLRLMERHVLADFDYEEEVMENVRYPDLATHREQHREFLRELGRLQDQLRGAGSTPENVGAIVDAVHSWLPSHVVGEDHRFTAFLQARRTP
jgi:hemerythrin-like metal-binding protein